MTMTNTSLSQPTNTQLRSLSAAARRALKTHPCAWPMALGVAAALPSGPREEALRQLRGELLTATDWNRGAAREIADEIVRVAAS